MIARKFSFIFAHLIVKTFREGPYLNPIFNVHNEQQAATLMGKSLSSILAFLRQKHSLTCQNFNTHVRNFIGETKVGEFISEVSRVNVRSEAVDSGDQSFREIAKEISRITRTKSRWEETLVSEYPFLNLSDPQFFDDVLKQQNNVLLALRFFYWLHSQYKFLPNQSSCGTLFDALVDAKACKAAMSFLDTTGFSPAPISLERYFQCLCEVGLVEEALSVLNKLKAFGYSPSIETWNVALLSCGKNGRTESVWKLYQEMMDSGVVANIDVQTVGNLILAFCHDKEVLKGFELFQEILGNGMLPSNSVLNKLISALCAQGEYSRVSQVLHAMISGNQNPDICTYQEIINGLLKKSKLLEGLRVFNDLKDRGYYPHGAMYTTLISGLCHVGWLVEARILWFEMRRKGIVPNEYTYNALLYGYFKAGNFKEGWKLYQEMCLKGYGETPVSYNTMISGFCSCEQGCAADSKEWLFQMMRKNIKLPKWIFQRLIRGLLVTNRFDDTFVVLDFMFRAGYALDEKLCHSLVDKFCKGDSLDVMDKVLHQ